MNGGDIAVPPEVGGIERENGIHRVDAHEGYQAGIIYFDALDAVVLDDPFPTG